MEEAKQSPSPPPSPMDDSMRSEEVEVAVQRPKKRKKRRSDEGDKYGEGKKIKKRKEKDHTRTKKEKPRNKHYAQQLAVQDQMRRALEDDRYSAVGSIVSDTESEADEDALEKSDIKAAMRKRLWVMERKRLTNIQEETDKPKKRSGKKKRRKKRSKEGARDGAMSSESSDNDGEKEGDEAQVFEEGSIFGPTTGSSHATWVECDKCKKWRRLRGVVDETKLPSRWYCSMNKNDPDRARCSAPEEEYSETAKPEEDAADARTRKHLRVWVRRLRSQEAFRDMRRPVTRNKRRDPSRGEQPYEWVRCNACGKWRCCLRFMDKSQLLDRHSEWYCVMNTWDEKTASCAAPQENLPAIGCPPWVMQDEN